MHMQSGSSSCTTFWRTEEVSWSASADICLHVLAINMH